MPTENYGAFISFTGPNNSQISWIIFRKIILMFFYSALPVVKTKSWLFFSRKYSIRQKFLKICDDNFVGENFDSDNYTD